MTRSRTRKLQVFVELTGRRRSSPTTSSSPASKRRSTVYVELIARPHPRTPPTKKNPNQRRKNQPGVKQVYRRVLLALDPFAKAPILSEDPFSVSLADTPSSTDPATARVFRQIVSWPDKFNPLRDFHPSVVPAREIFSDGSSDRKPLDTPVGLFNVLLSRVITCSTPFLLRGHQTYFASWPSYKTAVSHAKQAGLAYPADFCNKRVYGQAMGRDIELAETYWYRCAEMSESIERGDGPLDWPFALNGKGKGKDENKPTFTAFYRWLVRDPRTKATRFPQCGPFLSTLVANDYARLGQIQTPSPIELGRLLAALHLRSGSRGSGAVKGLGMLEYAVGSRAEIEKSFVAYCREMEGMLKREGKVGVWDAIVAENVLCKATRLEEAMMGVKGTRKSRVRRGKVKVVTGAGMAARMKLRSGAGMAL